MSTEDVTRTLRLSVPGITCQGWAISTRVAVGHLNGVDEVSADVKARTLAVRYEPSDVTIESIQQALLRIGYESTILSWYYVGQPPGQASDVDAVSPLIAMGACHGASCQSKWGSDVSGIRRGWDEADRVTANLIETANPAAVIQPERNPD